MNDDWLTTDKEGRARIIKETTAFTKGLLYFLTSDASLPVNFAIMLVLRKLIVP